MACCCVLLLVEKSLGPLGLLDESRVNRESAWPAFSCFVPCQLCWL